MTRRRRCRPPLSRRLRVKRPALVLFVLALALALDGSGTVRIGLVCALLHEGGHLAAYRLLLGRWPALEISPTGLCIPLRGTLLPPRAELLLAAAGIAANLACCALAALLMAACLGYSYAGYWFISANLLLAGLNMLPLPGLDGARIIGCLRDIAKG